VSALDCDAVDLEVAVSKQRAGSDERTRRRRAFVSRERAARHTGPRDGCALIVYLPAGYDGLENNSPLQWVSGATPGSNQSTIRSSQERGAVQPHARDTLPAEAATCSAPGFSTMSPPGERVALHVPGLFRSAVPASMQVSRAPALKATLGSDVVFPLPSTVVRMLRVSAARATTLTSQRAVNTIERKRFM